MLRTYSATGSILIDGGAIDASGQDGTLITVPGGAGGAGGTIVLLSHSITLRAATLTANGGDADGAGGGAGKIVIAADTLVQQDMSPFSVQAVPGASGVGKGGIGGGGGGGGKPGVGDNNPGAKGKVGAGGAGGVGRVNNNFSTGGTAGPGGAGGTNGVGGGPGGCFLTYDGIILGPLLYWDEPTNSSGNGWQLPGFNDSGWHPGVGVMGYGNGDEQTVLNSSNGAVTVYFRLDFVETNLTRVTNLMILLRRQDGVVGYLNGNEVLRDNMPIGPILPSTYALEPAPDDGTRVFHVPVSPGFLRQGENVMAAEVHRASANKRYLTFDLDLVMNSTVPPYTQTFVPGYTAFTPQLQNGPTPPLIEGLLPNPPIGTTVSIWTPLGMQTESYQGLNSAWIPGTNTLAVGQGAILFNPSPQPFDILISGTPPDPLPTFALSRAVPALVGSPLPGPATFEQIVGHPPENGTEVARVVPGPGESGQPKYAYYQFSNGSWQPSEPVAGPGEALQITLPCVSLSWPSPLVLEAQSPQGAFASYRVTAEDDCGSTLLLAYSPPTGSWLSLGTHDVTVVAQDEAAHRLIASFTLTVVDTTPPEILFPSNFVVEATSPAGAVVNFTNVSATDLVDPAPHLAFEPPSGSVFPLGVTHVQATAWDASRNTNQIVFPVTVANTNAPAISGPTNLTLLQTLPQGAQLFYDLQLSDVADTNVQVTSTFPSGSILPVGTYTNTCTATDSSGNTKVFSFQVIVVPPTPGTISSIDYNPGQIILSFPAQPGVQYVVEYKDSLTDPAWQYLTTVVGNPGSMQVIDYAPGPSTRFYRIQAP